MHYIPVDEASISPYHPYGLAAKRAEQNRLYLQWRVRHAEQVARDRANRRIVWRVVIGASLVVLAAFAFAAWQLARAVAGHADAVIGGAALVIAACVLGPVLIGGGCKTVITIWHSHR